MAYLGLVPSERSTGDSIKRGGDHQGRQPAGTAHAGRGAWSYRHPPRVGREKQAQVEAAPPAVREIAWKAQARLTARYRALRRSAASGRRRRHRDRARAGGFIWAIGRDVGASRTPASERTADLIRSRPPDRGPRQTSCNGGGEATAGELPRIAVWPVANDRRPRVDAGQPRTKLGHAVSNPRIRA